MNNQDIISILKQGGGKIPIPYFDHLPITVQYEYINPVGYKHVSLDEALATLKNFLSISSQQRLNDSRHLYRHYQFLNDACGNDMLEGITELPIQPKQIWDFTTPISFHLTKMNAGEYDPPSTVFLSLEAQAEWESHGLQIVWKEGKTLIKSGPYDGHLTNGKDNEAYIFHCYDPKFATLREQG